MRRASKVGSREEGLSMAKLDFSKHGDEHFKATMRECLEDILKRGDYLLFDGDLYWSPFTLLRVHTSDWLSTETTVTWWPAGTNLEALAEAVGGVTFKIGNVTQVFVLFPAQSIPRGDYSNFL